MYYPGMYAYMWILLPAMLLTLWAQFKVKSTFSEFSQVRSSRGLTGRQAARAILDSYGLRDVPIKQIAGSLTDHYDPSNRSLSLSQSVYDSPSIAAIGVAAHEVGHAVQDATGYAPLRFRNAIVPVVNLTSQRHDDRRRSFRRAQGAQRGRYDLRGIGSERGPEPGASDHDPQFEPARLTFFAQFGRSLTQRGGRPFFDFSTIGGFS